MLRVLIIGAGDVARRILPLLVKRCQVTAVLRDAGRAKWWREHGAFPVLADLDRRDGRSRLRGLIATSQWVIYLAPPSEQSGRNASRDGRLRQILALRTGQNGPRSLTQRWVYISTTGVYGDLNGDWADETASVHPGTSRSRRRVDAEQQLRRRAGPNCRASILRVPGIYAADRLPLARLAAGTPALRAEDDVFTNHIHADDLARIVLDTLRRGRTNRIYNAVDDSAMRMGDYFDAVADVFDLQRPRRVARSEAEGVISPALLSFMSESRRLSNHRLKHELGVRLTYPTVIDGLRAARCDVGTIERSH